MHKKPEAYHCSMVNKKVIAVAVALVMLFSILPASVFALGNSSEYLCGHVHDEACGYMEGSEGAPCMHEHDESCYTIGCSYVCEHTCSHVCDESCQTQLLTCSHVCGEECQTRQLNCSHVCGEECSDGCIHICDENCYTTVTQCVHIHDESCYTTVQQCTHVHDETCGGLCTHICDDSCQTQTLTCLHQHDESCGYVEPVLGSHCNHICEILSFNGFTPGAAISTYEAIKGETYEEICSKLPETLLGELSCAEGDTAIPVFWNCTDFTGAAGTYIFRAELTNAYCTYIAQDNELTESIDESELPFITVTVPETSETTAPTAETTEPTVETPPESGAPVIAYQQRTIQDETGAVTVAGLLPESAYLIVTEVSIADAQALLGETETVILFAYDIKIMLPGDTEPTEFQPGADNPVTVTINPPQPIEAPVEVVHVAEDEATGKKTPQTVADVTATENCVEFEAEEFSIYIGTIGTGTEIRLNPGTGYTFYSDAGCGSGTEISGIFEVTTVSRTVYLKANTGYTIEAVSINNGDGTASSVTPSKIDGVWSLVFPENLSQNQIITVITYVSATGGVISDTTTPADVAAIFDATAEQGRTVTDNVSVTVNGETFIVKVLNNILLEDTIIVNSGASVTLTTQGNYIIKRDVAECKNAMFEVNGTLSLGDGTGSGGTVTYHYSNNTSSAPLAPYDSIPTPPLNANITDVTVNRSYQSNTEGTLTIDGGAFFSEPVNAATRIKPACTTPSTGCIVDSTGTLKLWANVTLQNNYNDSSSDEATYAGVRIQNGLFYMYGGTIRQCSTMRSGSQSDGGGVCFTDGDAYFYGGEITECCADNGAAVAIFGEGSSPTAYYLGTHIYNNLAGGDLTYPGQACSAYAGAAVLMFAGKIINNKNTFASTDADADYDMKPSGENSGVNLFSGTIGKLGVVYGAIVNVYGCSIGIVNGAGNVVYKKGYAVTVPDCVAPNTIDAVKISVRKENAGTYEDYITITKTGDGMNRSLDVDLLAGTYQITVESTCMRKCFTATVSNAPVIADPTSRTMTVPVVLSQTSNSITMQSAGTGNTEADGVISYGYSTTSNANDVPQLGNGTWQESPFFSTTDLTGNIYFFVRASQPSQDDHNFGESISPGLVVNLSATPSVVINVTDHNSVPMNTGKSTTLNITTTPEKYDVNKILWTISGQNHIGTCVTRRDDGSGSLKIDADESAITLTVTVELLDNDGQTIDNGVFDTITVRLNQYAYIEHTHSEAPTTLTAQLCNVSGGTYSYVWQKADANSESFETIPRQTSNTLETDYSYIGKRVRVIITNDGNTFTSEPITILAPQLSITVPSSILVSVDGAGGCTVAGGAIRNNSAVEVYLTEVSYKWKTDGPQDANELFSDWATAKPIPTLTFGSTEHSFNYSGNDTIIWNGISSGNSIGAGLTITASWGFTLNGNSIALPLAVGNSIHVATVTYTVGYEQTSQ